MQEMDGVEYLYHYQSNTTDCWTSQQTKGYMTVTLHFINAQWQLRSKVLSNSTTQVEGSDDAQNLAPGMQKVFQARCISEKVKTITSDNSPNVKAAVELLQVKPCFMHTLNLAMKDVIRNLDDVFATPNVKWRILLLQACLPG